MERLALALAWCARGMPSLGRRPGLQGQQFSPWFFFFLICGPQNVCAGGVGSLRKSAWRLFAAYALALCGPQMSISPPQALHLHSP